MPKNNVKKCLKKKKTFFSGPGNVQFERLDEGEHFFPFAFTLPHDVPCSFESVNGHIGYRASATMWLPNNISQTTNASFLVLRESDLNFEPFILVSMDKSFVNSRAKASKYKGIKSPYHRFWFLRRFRDIWVDFRACFLLYSF